MLTTMRSIKSQGKLGGLTRTLALAAVAVMVACTAASPSASPSASTQTSSTPTPKVGGNLIVASTGIKNLDPIMNTLDATHYVQSQIYSSLVAIDQNLNPIPDLAESWSNTSPTEWVFKLRKGAMWQDDNEIFPKGKSREVVASDIKFAYDTYKDPKVASLKGPFLASVVSTEVVDQYTVKITTSGPDAFLLSQIEIPGVPIFPKEAWDKYGVAGFATHAVGSGPFKLKEYAQDDHVTLVRNDLYWTKPNLDQVTFKVIPDYNVALQALKAGEVDVLQTLQLKDIPTFQSDSQFKILNSAGAAGTGATGSLYMYYFNMQAAPFTDINMRKAVTLATDRTAIAKQVWGDTGVPVYGVNGPGMVGYNAALKDKYGATDLNAAKKLLDDAGWKAGSDGIRVKDGQRLTITVTMTNSNKDYETATLVLQDQLKAAGIEIKLDSAAGGTQIPNMRAGKFQMMIINAFCCTSGLMQAFLSTNINNSDFSRYTNPQVDNLLNQGIKEVDPAKRGPIWQQAEDLAMADYPVLPIGRQYPKGATSAKVHDFPAAQFSLGLVNAKNNTWKD